MTYSKAPRSDATFKPTSKYKPGSWKEGPAKNRASDGQSRAICPCCGTVQGCKDKGDKSPLWSSTPMPKQRGVSD